MLICREFIEETECSPGLIFNMWGYFGLARTSSSLQVREKISLGVLQLLQTILYIHTLITF